MKSNLAATILLLACLGLGVVLWNQHQRHADETRNLDLTISNYSTNIAGLTFETSQERVANELLRYNLSNAQSRAANDLAQKQIELDAVRANLARWQGYSIDSSNAVKDLYERFTELKDTNSALQADLAKARLKSSNDIAAIQATLSNAYANLDKARSDAKTATDQASAAIADKDKQIAQLQAQNADLDRQSTNLLAQMTNLQAQADAAKRKLDVTEGDNRLLMSEWRLVESQKEELQKKLNDVAALKAQLKTVEENIVIARRVDWIERGIYQSIEKKGDQNLISPPTSGHPAANVALSVDLHQNGDVRITTPVPTNTPSTNKPTARAPSVRSGP